MATKGLKYWNFVKVGLWTTDPEWNPEQNEVENEADLTTFKDFKVPILKLYEVHLCESVWVNR